MDVSTRPTLPVDQRIAPEHWITDEVAAEARRLWKANPRASQIECALIAATRAIAPLCERLAAAEAPGSQAVDTSARRTPVAPAGPAPSAHPGMTADEVRQNTHRPNPDTSPDAGEAPPVTCMDCSRAYDEGAPDSALWVALGPDGVGVDAALVFCPDCWPDDQSPTDATPDS